MAASSSRASPRIGSTSGLLAALDWVMSNHAVYNIRVVNLSVGTPAVDAYFNDPMCQAVRRLVDSGIVVVAAAGNTGKDSNGTKVYGQIHSPANEPSAITVGASNTFGTDARGDDAITTYSSRGPTRSYWTDTSGVKHYDNVIKPDIAAANGTKVSILTGKGDGTFNAASDIKTLEQLLAKKWEVPLCVIGMGPLGTSTRVSFACSGSCLTYGYVDTPSAPGQLSAQELVAQLRKLFPAFDEDFKNRQR